MNFLNFSQKFLSRVGQGIVAPTTSRTRREGGYGVGGGVPVGGIGRGVAHGAGVHIIIKKI